MFKKQLLLAGLMLLTLVATAQKKTPFYYELISNESKTINFIFGFYPTTYVYAEGKDVDPYTSVRAAVINSSKNSLEWDNYKIMVLLKSGKLIRSYTTAAKEGDYACTYKVSGTANSPDGKGETHTQYYCFHHKFTNEDIDKVWLVIGDDQIFNLSYDKNEG